jgi:hypothetical protein
MSAARYAAHWHGTLDEAVARLSDHMSKKPPLRLDARDRAALGRVLVDRDDAEIGGAVKAKKYKKTIRNVLIRARRLVRAKGGWTQDSYAKDKDGKSTAPTMQSATCFCALGAIKRAKAELGLDECDSVGTVLFRVVGYIPEWNDVPGRTQAEVVDAFTKAIALTPKPELRK